MLSLPYYTVIVGVIVIRTFLLISLYVFALWFEPI